MRELPVVAVVGAPNVGKSSLVNRILGRRHAVVAGEPGTTRDRSYNEAEWAGREFTLVDTGGMEPLAKVGLEALVTLQAKVAAEEADVIVHLTDSRTGITDADAAIARELRSASSTGSVLLAVNKLDNPTDDADRYQFYSLGEGEPHSISAMHGLGTGDLLDEVVARLPEAEAAEEDGLPRLAIIGRPNVGKSTLLNRLIGSERAVVSETPGTTTDAVAGEVATPGGERYLLLDTAGVNRAARRARGAPYYSSLRTDQAINTSDVSLLLVDAVEGIVGDDLRLARSVEEAGKSLGVVVNKRDLVPPEKVSEIAAQVLRRLTDLKPPAMAVSALTGSGVDGILSFAEQLRLAFNFSVPTHEVAEYVNYLVGHSAPPGGVKIRYATQTGSAPPRFTLFATRPLDVPEGYLRYIENSFRERYDLWGVSVRLRVRSSR